MSTYGEEILDFNRLNPNSNLSNPESDGYKLFDETLGWFLDNKVDGDVLSQTFVLTATGAYLDLLGRTKGVYRVKDETDDVYRNRILCLINLQFNKARVFLPAASKIMSALPLAIFRIIPCPKVVWRTMLPTR